MLNIPSFHFASLKIIPSITKCNAWKSSHRNNTGCFLFQSFQSLLASQLNKQSINDIHCEKRYKQCCSARFCFPSRLLLRASLTQSVWSDETGISSVKNLLQKYKRFAFGKPRPMWTNCRKNSVNNKTRMWLTAVVHRVHIDTKWKNWSPPKLEAAVEETEKSPSSIQRGCIALHCSQKLKVALG